MTMADNVNVEEGRQGQSLKVATDDIGGIHIPRFKLVHGPDGVNYGDIDYENPFPVLPSTHAYSKGQVFGHEALRKFGINTLVPTTENYVGGTGAALPYLPITAVNVELISGNANDAAGGTGARTVTIAGLDANYDRQTEEITMNGTSATTATTNTYIRIYRAYVETAGTYAGTNAGLITIRASGGGASFATIVAGSSQSQETMYTVARGHGLFVKDIHITTESNKTTSVKMWQHAVNGATAPFNPKRIVHQYIGLASSQDFEYSPEIYFPEKTDIWFTAVVGASTGAVSIEYNGILETA